MKQILVSLALLTLASCAHSPRPWSSAEKALFTASILAQAADTYTSIRASKNPATYEANPALGRHPSSTKLIAFGVSSELLTLLLGHYLEDFRGWFFGGKAVLSTGLAIHNSRLDD